MQLSLWVSPYGQDWVTNEPTEEEEEEEDPFHLEISDTIRDAIAAAQQAARDLQDDVDRQVPASTILPPRLLPLMLTHSPLVSHKLLLNASLLFSLPLTPSTLRHTACVLCSPTFHHVCASFVRLSFSALLPPHTKMELAFAGRDTESYTAPRMIVVSTQIPLVATLMAAVLKRSPDGCSVVRAC
jgi:hypothetical protein